MIFRKKTQKKKQKSKARLEKAPVKLPSRQPPKPYVPPAREVERQKTDEKKPSDPYNAEKEFLNVFRQLTTRHRVFDVWRDFIVMFACTLSNVTDMAHYREREERYLKIIRKYNKQEQALFPELIGHTVETLERNQEQDFLGDIYTKLNLHDEGRKQFFTPYCVCQTMAEITMQDIAEQVEKQGYITINDPCCGAGATLIAGINTAKRRLEKANLNFQNHVLIAAQDIDETVALMCYIQLSLLGVAAYVKVGNSLTEPMCEGDALDNYWFTLMYFSNVWTMRRMFKKIGLLEEAGKKG